MYMVQLYSFIKKYFVTTNYIFINFVLKGKKVTITETRSGKQYT